MGIFIYLGYLLFISLFSFLCICCYKTLFSVLSFFLLGKPAITGRIIALCDVYMGRIGLSSLVDGDLKSC